MKKTFVLLFAAVIAAFTVSCACSNEQKENNEQEAVVGLSAPSLTTSVEHLLATDRQDMFLNYGGDYIYYETQVTFAEYFDKADDCKVEKVRNVFQIVEGGDGQYDTHVILYTHDGEITEKEVVHSFWIEDYALTEVTLTLAEAYERMMECNIPKPHSRQCALRNPVGPYACNPQYVFGNIHQQVWVDAITGKVLDTNPSFIKPEGK